MKVSARRHGVSITTFLSVVLSETDAVRVMLPVS